MTREEINQVKVIAREIVKEEIALAMALLKTGPEILKTKAPPRPDDLKEDEENVV